MWRDEQQKSYSRKTCPGPWPGGGSPQAAESQSPGPALTAEQLISQAQFFSVIPESARRLSGIQHSGAPDQVRGIRFSKLIPRQEKLNGWGSRITRPLLGLALRASGMPLFQFAPGEWVEPVQALILP